MNLIVYRPWALIAGALATACLALLACGSGAPSTAAPAPQQPAAPAQPATAAPAADPVAAPAPQQPSRPPTALAPQPAKPAATVVKPKRGGIYRVGHRGDPQGAWDTMRSTNNDLTTVASSIYGDSNLVKPCREDQSEVCPGLAERWEPNADFSEWTFKIRDNVKWHDGTPFSAQDVKFWYDLGVNGAKVGDKTRLPAFSKVAFGPVWKVEVLDGNRVKITLGVRNPNQPNVVEQEPVPIYPALLAEHWAMIIQHPKHLMESRINQGEVNVSPVDIGFVGTGPFKFKSHQRRSLIEVRRSDIYWEKDAQGLPLPYLDGVDYYIFADPSAMHAAFRVGKLDSGARAGGYYVTQEQKPGYTRSLGDEVTYLRFNRLGGLHGGLAFNVLRPGPWQDVRVRRAMHLWVDRQEAINILGGGDGEVATFVSPRSRWANPDLPTWPGFNPKTKAADREQAKRLLAEAGYAQGFSAKVLARRAQVTNFEWIQGHVLPLGIKLIPDLIDDAVHPQRVLEANWDMHADPTVNASLPDLAAPGLNQRSLSPRSQAVHEDPKIAQLFQNLNRSLDQQTRLRLYWELERYAVLEQTYVILNFSGIDWVPVRTYVRGLITPIMHVAQPTDYATVWLDR